MTQSDMPAKFSIFPNLDGGMATRNTPLMREANAEQALKSSNLLNCEFFTGGSVKKRLGKSLANTSNLGGTVVWQNQTTNNSVVTMYTPTAGNINGWFQKVVAGSTANIYSVTYNIVNGVDPSQPGYITNIYAVILASSAGLPSTTVIATSNVIPQSAAIPFNATGTPTTFNFSTLPTLTNGTTYYFGLAFTLNTIPIGTWGLADKNPGTGADLYFSNNNLSSFYVFVANLDLVYSISSIPANSSTNGLYDYHIASSGVQWHMAAAGGKLYYDTGSNTWTSLNSGFGSATNNIWSFATLQNYLFSTDYSVSNPQVWNGIAVYTMNLGFQAAYTAARSATGGTVAAGTYQIMLVTTMTSGGFRASAVQTVTTTAATDKIACTGVIVSGTNGSDFGFDIGTTATQVWMTLAGGSTFYLLATGSVSVGNPLPNGTTSFNITAPPAGTENTLVLQYTQPQGYFTNQVATPKGKYLEVFQNMLAMAGDPSNPSRVWFSSLGQPQIWSTYGGILGNYLDFNVNDGESITGIKQWNGNLYVFKRHSVFIVQYTGVANSPFAQKRLASNFGTLSHWCVQDIGSNGLIFLSERGPVVCLGTYVIPVPSTADILDRFQVTLPSSYNTAVMYASTSAVNISKNQIWWSVSTNGQSLRNKTLVFDYEKQIFWENDVVSNVYANVLDTNLLQQVWSSDYNGYVFIQDSGADDNGTSINWNWSTPDMQLGDPFWFKQLLAVYVAGTVQTSGTLFCDIYAENQSTILQTISFDMTKADFKSGQRQAVNQTARMFRFNFRNSQLDVPVELDSIGLDWVQRNKDY